MAWCLTKEASNKFKQALLNKEVDPFAMAEISSEDRRNLLSKYVGEENSHQVNRLFESKLLLKNKTRGYQSWAKRVGGITKETRRDLLAKIERLNEKDILNPQSEEAFLEDLVATRLGLSISATEAQNIFELSKRIEKTLEKANQDGTFETDSQRLDYGLAMADFEQYVNDLKIASRKIDWKQEKTRFILQPVKIVPGVAKSLLSSWDNSFFGRQGIKTLLNPRTANIWARGFLKSWRDIAREIGGRDAMRLIRADILSRPNAINGKYRLLGKNSGLDVLSEEAFPSSLPARVPVFGRIYKASESAFNGGALRMRADLADRLINIAEKQGINTKNREEMEGIGTIIGSLTGRGSLGKAEGVAEWMNLLFFSVKFLKSNIDTLTAHQFDSKATPFARKQARQNLITIIGTIAGILAIAKWLDPDSVEEDPRSTNFGKIRIFGRWVDITGGMASLVTLASRVTPSYHNGEWGFWTKNKEGIYKNGLSGEYGQATALDTMENFFAGKFSPALGLLRDVWKGQTYSGDPITAKGIVMGSTVPITIQQYQEMLNDPNNSFFLATAILEGLGLSSSPQQYGVNWNRGTSKELNQFKEKVGEDKFKEANDKFNQQYLEWFKSVNTKEEYQNLTDEGKRDAISGAKERIKEQILREYRFKYRKEKTTIESKKEKRTISNLIK